MAGVIALAQGPEPSLAEAAVVYPGVHSAHHEWLCGETYFDLLIDGDSVKLGPKIFTAREIEQLKTKNANSYIGKTTYEVFTEINEKIKFCEYELGTFTVESPGPGGAIKTTDFTDYDFTYTGTVLDGVPSGYGYYRRTYKIVPG